MVRAVNRLSALRVDRLRAPGHYPDGDGLYLQVSKTGTKSWCYRFTLAGRTREMGLGPYPAVTLADARKQAAEARRLKAAGIDPIDARRARRDALRAERARRITFDEAAARYIAAHERGWRNRKHAAQWRATLKAYASPVFGSLPVGTVDTPLVVKALEPIWTTKPETASRVRGRIEAVLDWAATRGYRTGANPARWKGHLQKVLPPPAKVRRTRHHAALPYAEAPAFMARLRQQVGTAARALQFLIYTAARTSEVVGATWDEIDFDTATWCIPGDRIKAGREHRVPLSPPALALLRDQLKMQRQAGYGGRFVFPGDKPGRPLSGMAMLMLLRRLGRDDVTIHGFRSTFRDWAAERTNYPREVAEQALAHAVRNKSEAAYFRSDLFEKRRRLMAEWARFCTAPAGGAVVPIRRK